MPIKPNGTIDRALRQIATRNAKKARPMLFIYDGRAEPMADSLHRSRSGVRLNKLLRQWCRSHPPKQGHTHDQT